MRTGRTLLPECWGEVIVQGDHIMARYWNQPEMRASTIKNVGVHPG